MGTTPDQGKGIGTSVRVRPDQSLILEDDLKLSINPPALSSERDAMSGYPGYVAIGEDIETGKKVYIGDIERRSGLYVGYFCPNRRIGIFQGYIVAVELRYRYTLAFERP